MKCAALFVLLAGQLWAAGPATDLAAAETLYLQRDFAAARAAFEQLAVVEPARASHSYFLGKIAIRERRFPEAVALLRVVVGESPGNADYQHWLGNAHAWSAAEAKNLADRAAQAAAQPKPAPPSSAACASRRPSSTSRTTSRTNCSPRSPGPRPHSSPRRIESQRP